MYEVAQADVLKFITTDWIPVHAPGAVGTDQADVETTAVDGALEHIDVLSGGAIINGIMVQQLVVQQRQLL